MTRSERFTCRLLATHHPMVALAGTLALAACAADGIDPGSRVGQLEGSPTGAVAGAAAPDGSQPSAAQDASSGSSYALAAAGFKHYVAFGDSFVSGVGASNVTWKPCGTSPTAWPYQVQKSLAIPDMVFAACSGATTQDVAATGGLKMQSQMSKLPPSDQLDSTLITIAIGGNDIKLDERLSKCLKSATSSTASSSSSTTSVACLDLDKMLNNALAVVNESLAPSLDYTFKALRTAAPNATIVAVGYPHLVDATSASCNRTATGVLINRAKRQKLNKLADAINAQVKTAATNAGIIPVVDEIVAAFEGHGACSPNEWIVSADAFLKTGNAGVAHPNDAGYKVYAQTVLKALSGVKAKSAVVTDPSMPPTAGEPIPGSEIPEEMPLPDGEVGTPGSELPTEAEGGEGADVEPADGGGEQGIGDGEEVDGEEIATDVEPADGGDGEEADGEEIDTDVEPADSGDEQGTGDGDEQEPPDGDDENINY